MAFEIALSPRARKSPYFDATVAAGVTAFSIYNHTYFPLSYGSMEQEYWRLVNDVAIWDVACQRQIELHGPDAADLAQFLCARDLSSTAIGQGKYVPMCDHDGRLVNDPLLLRVDEDRWWFSIADVDMLGWCRAFARERHFDVDVNELDVAPLAIQGPKAEDVVADLLGDWVRDIKFFRYARAELDGIELQVGRAGWSTKGGFELYLESTDRGVELWDRVVAAGEPYGIGPGTPNHMERIESGFFSMRTDTDDHTDPFEMRLDRYVSFAPGIDYLGREALEAKFEQGPRRRLVGLRIEGDRRAPNSDWLPLHGPRRDVGTVRSLAWSPRLESMLALGVVDIDCCEIGTVLKLESEGAVRKATVSEVPFL
ncbi:MAG: glycine cleavage T C-terminal barrel domain-containing protein [Actinomycetota bacterium]